MCKYATYVSTVLVFVQYAGVNPCKNNVSTTGNAAIKHSGSDCCLSAQPTYGALGRSLWGTDPDCSLSQKTSRKVKGSPPTETASSCSYDYCCVQSLVRVSKQSKVAVEAKCTASLLTPYKIHKNILFSNTEQLLQFLLFKTYKSGSIYWSIAVSGFDLYVI